MVIIFPLTIIIISGLSAPFIAKSYGFKKPIVYATVSNEIALKSDNDFEIKGKVTGGKKNGKVKVYYDDKYTEKIKYTESTFSYTVDLSSFSPGWHYIFFEPNQIVSNNKGMGIFINKPKNSKVISIVPESIVIEARKRNAEYIHNYNKRWPNENDKYSAQGPYWIKQLNSLEEYGNKLDKNGIPLITIEDQEVYNPVTISQFALGLYKPSWKTDKTSYNKKTYQTFIKVANWLVDNMDADGSHRYQYEHKFLDNKFYPGWVSGMAQGQVLSVLGRAYYLTGNERYQKAGEKTLDFMLKHNISKDTSKHDGASDIFKDFTDTNKNFKPFENLSVCEEILVSPQVYILNGNAYAAIGLFDWFQLSSNKESAQKANKRFEECVKAIEVALPYYDYYGMSAYDLRQYTAEKEVAFYSTYAHSCHIILLKQLYLVTGNEVLNDYYETFKSYSDDKFYAQYKDLYRAEQ